MVCKPIEYNRLQAISNNLTTLHSTYILRLVWASQALGLGTV